MPDLPWANDKSKCSLFESAQWITGKQCNLATTVFHVLLHDNAFNGIEFCPGLKGRDILDYSKQPGAAAGNPEVGYGVWQAMQLRTASPGYPVLNEDSYALFTLETWWSQHCGVRLQAPLTQQAAHDGFAPVAGAISPIGSDSDLND